MSAYAVGFLTVRNKDWQEEYGPKQAALVKKYQGKVLAAPGSAMEVLEGDVKLPSALVLIEFPSMEAAKGWYNDPDQAALIKLRQTGADFDLILVEGR